jgi:hypothetical protein
MSGILAQLGVVDEVQTTPAMSSIAPSAGPPTIFTITFASAHGLQPQDTITISGATPSAYNGTWTVFTAPTATTVTVVTTSLLAANTIVGTYSAGIYARGGTVTRFYDITPPETMKLQSPRIESAGLRFNNRVQKADKWAINRTGASGGITLEVQAKGFALLLKHLMGTVAQTGPTDSAFTYTATIGAMLGKSFLMQLGKPMTQSQVPAPFTYPGCKVIDWTLACAVDGNLMLTLTLDAYDEQVNVVLATASYPTNSDILTYAGGVISIGGVGVDISSFTLKCTMGYKADRRFMRANTLQREPAEGPMRDFSFDLVAEFTDMTQYNRFAATTRAGALSTISAVFTGPTLIGATTFPSLTVNSAANSARFDSDSPTIPGPDLLPLPLSGKFFNSAGGTNDACTLIYVTADSTP